jgi:magnesium transporter
MDGFGSITSNSVNDIMKILTALTLILSIPMVMAALYGMNVRLPLAEDVNAFWYVCGASAVIALGTSIWFYFKKMF